MSTELDAISLCARVRGFYHGYRFQISPNEEDHVDSEFMHGWFEGLSLLFDERAAEMNQQHCDNAYYAQDLKRNIEAADFIISLWGKKRRAFARRFWLFLVYGHERPQMHECFGADY